MADRRMFISYSHADRKWLERLQVHLRPLIRDSIADIWDDTRIQAGDAWLKPPIRTERGRPLSLCVLTWTVRRTGIPTTKKFHARISTDTGKATTNGRNQRQPRYALMLQTCFQRSKPSFGCATSPHRR